MSLPDQDEREDDQTENAPAFWAAEMTALLKMLERHPSWGTSRLDPDAEHAEFSEWPNERSDSEVS